MLPHAAQLRSAQSPDRRILANRFRGSSKSGTRGVASFESTRGCALKLMKVESSCQDPSNGA